MTTPAKATTCTVYYYAIDKDSLIQVLLFYINLVNHWGSEIVKTNINFPV